MRRVNQQVTCSSCLWRQDVENELVAQVSMKQEMELAMKLLEKDIHEKQTGVSVQAAASLTSEAVLQAVLHDHEELLQRRVVRVQRPAEAQSRLDQAFDAELRHVQQVGSLHGHRVTHRCGENEPQFKYRLGATALRTKFVVKMATASRLNLAQSGR
ncbi:hypothetical protein CCH79_00010524, partial [Gambusia affinis]